MKISVIYEKEFGNTENADKYIIAAHTDPGTNEVKVFIRFDSWADGQNTESTVRGGKFSLPKRQAIALATTILQACHSEREVKIQLDENDLESCWERRITILALSIQLDMPPQALMIIALAKYNIETGSDGAINTYVSEEQAHELRKELSK
mgnify:CR=1 FL=1